MNEKEFDKLSRELFGEALSPYGFTNEGSRFCTFHRKVNDEIFHVIMPDLGSRGVWYDIKVAPVSPLLDPLFESKFPDDIGMFTNNLLSKYDGVGITQQQFNCKNEDNYHRVFQKEVRPLLVDSAVPYLDGIRTISDLLPLITVEFVRGIALHLLGNQEEARPLLKDAKNRFSGAKDPDLQNTAQYIDSLLAKT